MRIFRKNQKNLNTTGKSNASKDERILVAELRLKARAIDEKIRSVTSRIWDIDVQIKKANDDEVVNELKQIKEDILMEFDCDKNRRCLDELIDEIYQIEMDLYGESNIKSNSPSRFF